MARTVGAPDILVNKVGGVGARKPVEMLQESDWQQVWELNTMSPMRLARHALAAMRERNLGAAYLHLQ